MSNPTSVCIIGMGAWGSALACILAQTGTFVNLISASGRSSKPKYLPNNSLFLTVNGEIEEAVRKSSLIFLAPSSQHFRKVAAAIHPFVTNQGVISLTKGIEPNSGKTMSQILLESFDNVGVLSGGSHAEEVIMNLPFYLTLGFNSKNEYLPVSVEEIFKSTNASIELTEDMKGIELAAALKNIVAVSIGISDGLGLGDNFRSTLIVKGLQEISRFGKSLGCDLATFYSYAGLGDLIATSLSEHSRNRKFGFLLGQGVTLSEAKNKVGAVVEALYAIQGARTLIKREGISSHYFDVMSEILTNSTNPKKILTL